MGFLKDKYTKEYFTSRDADGNILDYGALGADEWLSGGIFSEIKEPIDLVNLRGKKVLEIGYGRGESGRYILLGRGASYYLGVDFSPAAYELASKTMSDVDPSRYELKLEDALTFFNKHRFIKSFDCIFMLDSIEHIPVNEMRIILPLLYSALKPRGFLVVDTPFYSVDEDFVAQGGKYIAPSATDLHEKTSGMHCNKYTRKRLHEEMKKSGFWIKNDKVFKRPLLGMIQRIYRYLLFQ